AGLCADCAERCPPSFYGAGKSVARISRLDFAGGLWRICAGRYRRPHVSGAGTPAENSPVAFDLLSPAAAGQSFYCHHAAALGWIWFVHRRDRERIFHGTSSAAVAGGCGDRGMAFVRGDPAGTTASSDRSKTDRRALHRRFQRRVEPALGNYVFGSNTSNAMNLFCVGLSHHIANVETRERFAGGDRAASVLRAAGCAEALVLATCNRVEVYGASQRRIPTDVIAQCLARTTNVSRDSRETDEEELPPFYRYEDEKCV